MHIFQNQNQNFLLKIKKTNKTKLVELGYPVIVALSLYLCLALMIEIPGFLSSQCNNQKKKKNQNQIG